MQAVCRQELPFTELCAASMLVPKANQEKILPEGSVEKLYICIQNSPRQELFWVW